MIHTRDLGRDLNCDWASVVAQTIKNMPAMQDAWV